jgi:hypothetical protein
MRLSSIYGLRGDGAKQLQIELNHLMLVKFSILLVNVFLFLAADCTYRVVPVLMPAHDYLQ